MSGLLAAVGVLLAGGLAAASILASPGRFRSVAMFSALILCPILILGDQWHSAEIVDLRDSPSQLATLVALALALTVALALAFHRWPLAFPLAAIAALPFRVPLEAGGDTANLLVPLYLVLAGGVVAALAGEFTASSAGGRGGGGSRTTPPAAPPSPPDRTRGRAVTWLGRTLAAVVLLYALQTLYSPDFSRSLQNVCFFFVPFAVLYALLRDVEWSRKLLTWTLWVVAVEAVIFVLIGSAEWVSRELLWNDQVIRSNDFHTYFRVNSIFWDPNIYGRYLALVATIAMAALLWVNERRGFWLLTGLIAVLWFGLVPTHSQSSYFALLGGLAALAALRWSRRWTLGTIGAVAVLGALAVLVVGGFRPNVDTSGRANLVSGGIKLFKQRPVYGYGSGSFPKAYTEHVKTDKTPVSVSHTEPVTVAAEQGIVGLASYAALLVAALWAMAAGLHGPQLVGRAAVLAAFVALLVHTMAYAGFYEDPIAWVLLAVGASLAAVPVRAGT